MINDKLKEIQQTLKVPKGQYNSFAKYYYRSCEDILEAVKPLLNENGLTLTLSDTVSTASEWAFLNTTVSLSDGKETITVTGCARIDRERKGMTGDQLTGAASSYARKYALNGLFAIDDTKDSDATNTHGKDDVASACATLASATTLDELKTLYMSLSASLQKDVEVIAMKDQLKNKLTV